MSLKGRGNFGKRVSEFLFNFNESKSEEEAIHEAYQAYKIVGTIKDY